MRRTRAGAAALAVAVLAGVGACAGQADAGGAAFSSLPSAAHRWCGHDASELLPQDAPATLTIDEPVDLTADAAWHLRTTLDVPTVASGWASDATPTSEPAAHAIVYGTDVTLVRDGRVVAVQAGRAAPTVHEVVTAPSLGDHAEPALPFTDDVTGTFVACGGKKLRGDYFLVVTDTASLRPATVSPDMACPGSSCPGTPGATPTTPAPPDWPTLDGGTVVRVGASVPVQVATGPGGSTAPLVTATPEPAPVPTGSDPTSCGAPESGLRALAAEPSSIAVTLTTASLPPAHRGEPYAFGQRLTSTSATHADLLTGHPLVLVTRGGRVVGGPGEAVDAIGIGVQLDPGKSTQAPGLAASTLLRACDADQPGTVGDPLPAGDYAVWTVWSFTSVTVGPPQRIPETPAAGRDGSGTSSGFPAAPDDPASSVAGFVAVGGPWPLTIG